MIYKNAIINNEKKDILTKDGLIVKIDNEIAGIGDKEYDFNGKKVYPGLIDIHSHGCIGYDTMDGGKLEEMSIYMAKNGITSWLPTTMTMDFETIKSVTNVDLKQGRGAEILGFHMEGPYISPKYKGAQNEKYIKKPDINEFNALKNIKMVTIAPELEGSMDFIKKCNAVVSLGHTAADYETAKAAIKCGAKCLTHTFNAMAPIHHRNPGPIGAAYDENIFAQVICDGIHIHPCAVKILYKIFGSERMILISDSMRATGLDDGSYEFGGQNITVKNSVAKTSGGAIAGSTSNLYKCVLKAIEFGLPEREAFKMASETPSKLLGINKGMLKEGFDADFIAVNDDLTINNIVIKGEIF